MHYTFNITFSERDNKKYIKNSKCTSNDFFLTKAVSFKKKRGFHEREWGLLFNDTTVTF